MTYPYSQAEHDEAVEVGGIALVAVFALAILCAVAVTIG